jgi:hypothetical protein
MYILPKFSFSVASWTSLAACPLHDRGSDGCDATPSSVPQMRPSMVCSASLAWGLSCRAGGQHQLLVHGMRPKAPLLNAQDFIHVPNASTHSNR